jgi:hypothetical protein
MASKKPKKMVEIGPPREAIDFDLEEGKITQAQRAQITQLLMKRINDPKMRTMIVRFATYLAEGKMDDTFYSALYTYSLSENFDKLRQGYQDFGVASMDMTEFDDDLAEKLRKFDASSTRKKKK